MVEILQTSPEVMSILTICFKELVKMTQGDTVVIADTTLNQLKGLPVGRECTVAQTFDSFGIYHMLKVYDPVAKKSYYITDNMVNCQLEHIGV
jgi:hypothetical protein